MRGLLLIFAAVTLVAPAAALASHADPGDGTLVVRKASGDSKKPQTPVVGLALKGTVVGRLEHGKLIVFATDDQDAVVVTDDAGNPVDPTAIRENGAMVYATASSPSPTSSASSTGSTGSTGSTSPALRFKAIGGFYRIAIAGQGIDLNAVGRGTVVLDGSSEAPKDDGWYSLNGADKTSLPATRTGFPIGS